MPILIDAGDALYGELGVSLHPVVGIADERGKLVAYQHFLKVNMLDVVRGRIQVALGEIDDAQMARLVEPAAASIDLGKRSGAKSRFLLARALLARGSVEKAIENGRAGVALDPTFAPAHAILAKALFAAGQCAEAEREYAAALQLDPADPTAASRTPTASRAADPPCGPRTGSATPRRPLGSWLGVAHHSIGGRLTNADPPHQPPRSLFLALGSPAPRRRRTAAARSRFSPSAACASCHLKPGRAALPVAPREVLHQPALPGPVLRDGAARGRRGIRPSPPTRGTARPATRRSPTPTTGASPTSAGVTDPSLAGVTCDLCHTIVGYEGEAPQNGNFIASPGADQVRPLQEEGSHHGVYNELQTKSEVCAVCHEAVNSHGVRVKATFSEWKRSAFAKSGRPVPGLPHEQGRRLRRRRPVRVGSCRPDSLARGPRETRSTRTASRASTPARAVEGAVGLEIVQPPARVTVGRPATSRSMVDNGNAGHCLPTGQRGSPAPLARGDGEVGEGRPFALPADNRARGTWGAVGENTDDALLLGGDVPVGSRLYRAVYFDRRNHQTLASFDATSIAFDNRLQPGEKRREGYTFDLPRDATGQHPGRGAAPLPRLPHLAREGPRRHPPPRRRGRPGDRRDRHRPRAAGGCPAHEAARHLTPHGAAQAAEEEDFTMRHFAGAALAIALSTSLPARVLGAGARLALAQSGRAAAAAQRGATGYWPSATCGGCHPRTLDQQLQSHHERSFTNPIFQAQYFELVLPRASREPALAGEARSCTACHAPVAFANARGTATRAMTRRPEHVRRHLRPLPHDPRPRRPRARSTATSSPARAR